MQLQHTDKIYAGSIDIDQTPDANPWRDCVAVPVVGPEGQFAVDFYDREQMARGEEIRRGITVTNYSPEIGIALTKWARERGWVLYEDLCLGNVRGVEASPEHWRLWTRVVDLYGSGRTLRRGALEQVATQLKLQSPYHPEVARRRSLVSDGGMLSMDGKSALAFFGFAEGEDANGDDLLGALSEPPKRRK